MSVSLRLQSFFSRKKSYPRVLQGRASGWPRGPAGFAAEGEERPSEKADCVWALDSRRALSEIFQTELTPLSHRRHLRIHFNVFNAQHRNPVSHAETHVQRTSTAARKKCLSEGAHWQGAEGSPEEAGTASCFFVSETQSLSRQCLKSPPSTRSLLPLRRLPQKRGTAAFASHLLFDHGFDSRKGDSGRMHATPKAKSALLRPVAVAGPACWFVSLL